MTTRFLYNTLNKTPSSGKSLISAYMFFWWEGPEGGWGGGGHLFEFEYEGKGGGVEVGTNLRLGIH